MKVANECNADVVEALQVQIEKIIQAADAANPEITQMEITLALMETLGSVLLNITCPNCRRINRKNILTMLPTILRDAMTEAARYPQSSEHLH